MANAQTDASFKPENRARVRCPAVLLTRGGRAAPLIKLQYESRIGAKALRDTAEQSREKTLSATERRGAASSRTVMRSCSTTKNLARTQDSYRVRRQLDIVSADFNCLIQSHQQALTLVEWNWQADIPFS